MPGRQSSAPWWQTDVASSTARPSDADVRVEYTRVYPSETWNRISAGLRDLLESYSPS